MIRIAQVKIKYTHSEDELKAKIAKDLHISEDNILEYSIVKKSIDAREKNNICYIYTIDAKISSETQYLKRNKNQNIIESKTIKYSFTPTGEKVLKERPVIVGFGPAGIFCAYYLALNGYAPIIIEQGECIFERVKTVDQFWKFNKLMPNSNVQFGEGGAGAFSDGKLNTMVKDNYGRIRAVLELFVSFGAPSDILILNKPHIGTDYLRNVISNIRKEIIKLGGQIIFNTKLTDIEIENNKIVSICCNKEKNIKCETLVLAIGHSARDTYFMLNKSGVKMEQKAFAIGVRIEHKREMINEAQYGKSHINLPPADYKFTHQTGEGRGVYTFCMCPGGFVVNSSSENERLAVNGMSNYGRDENNSNSAVIVTVNPSDYNNFSKNVPEVLAGVEFQRYYEHLAWKQGSGDIPVQLFGDFINNKESITLGKISPNVKGNFKLGNLNECLPCYVASSIKEGVKSFGLRIKGFDDEEAVLSGVETRTSSPVRINRNENEMSNIEGIYPCGEGAGYAGGIVSAAIDGIKISEAIMGVYSNRRING